MTFYRGKHEICKSRALQEHVPLITQSSSVTEPTHTLVARQAQMVALLNWQQMRPHAKSQNPLQLCSAHGDFPVDWADLMCMTRKPAAIRAQLHPQARARFRVQGHSIKGCLPLHLKRQLQLIRLHLNRSTWVMRGTCSWSALLLQISETSTLHWLQSAQVSWLGLCRPETSPWSAGTSLLASIGCHADDGQTLFHPFSLVGCQGCCKLSFLP